MQLTDLIESTPDLRQLAEDGDAAGIVAAVNALTIDREDHTLRGPGRLQIALGQQVTAQMAYALASAVSQGGAGGAYMDDMRAIYRSNGLDLADDATRAGIDGLVAAGVLPAEVAGAVKSLGRWQSSLATEQLGDVVTPEQVEAALIQRARGSLYQRQAERYNALVDAMDRGDVNTDDEAAAFFGGA